MAPKVKQLPSLKGSKKPKTVVKNVLENPFSLKLPSIETELQDEIKTQLELSCSGLNIPVFKPPWSKLRILKGKKRSEYSQKYKENHLKKYLASPDSARKYELAKEGHTHLIFGYNAVMRALEQNKLAGILIKKEIQPGFLGQSFIPGCTNKHIPLVPVKWLDAILKREEILGLKHSILVLGLKLSVKESDCRFFPLYNSMMKVLSSSEKRSDLSSNVYSAEIASAQKGSKMEVDAENVNASDDDKENENENVKQKKTDESQGDIDEGSMVLKVLEKESENLALKKTTVGDHLRKGDEKYVIEKRNIANYKLSPEKIQTYHLKRSNSSKRVFIPQGKQAVKDTLEEVIHVEPSKVEKSLNDIMISNGESLKSAQKVNVRKKEKEKDFKLEFFIDTIGDILDDERQTESEMNVKKELMKGTIKDSGPVADVEYIPAMSKRVKSNPNRENKKRKI